MQNISGIWHASSCISMPAIDESGMLMQLLAFAAENLCDLLVCVFELGHVESLLKAKHYRGASF